MSDECPFVTGSRCADCNGRCWESQPQEPTVEEYCAADGHPPHGGEAHGLRYCYCGQRGYRVPSVLSTPGRSAPTMRGWINRLDRRWVMHCDAGCGTTAPCANDRSGLLSLARAGWFIAKRSGDLCPSCWRVRPTANEPHDVMAQVERERFPLPVLSDTRQEEAQ